MHETDAIIELGDSDIEISGRGTNCYYAFVAMTGSLGRQLVCQENHLSKLNFSKILKKAMIGILGKEVFRLTSAMSHKLKLDALFQLDLCKSRMVFCQFVPVLRRVKLGCLGRKRRALSKQLSSP